MTTGILYYAKGTLRVTKATDEDGKVQQNMLGGHDITTTTYSFSGKPLTVTHAHTATGKTSRTEVYTYTYDEKDRVSTVKHKLGSTEVTLATYTYDTFGRMATRQPHGNATNKLTYTYNIQSWLTGISSGKFTQTLGYGSNYNGNISSMNWNANGESHSYTFTYDGVNRMLNATHGTGAYTEKVTSYDKNGNIKALQRYGNGLIDNLTYTYSGNQLTKVEDATGNTNGFSNGASVANEYVYDNNGNLTKDSNKGITNIAYNCLNLPSTVTFTDGSTIVYSYAADGTKLRTVHTISGTTTQKDYCANVVYENGVQKMLLTEEGYVDLSVTTPAYYYYLKDHQGNNRVVINSSGTVQETNHYYPFGSLFASTSVQPYKYNGKELDTKKGLNWYDYGARHYDASLGRWFVVDPLVEKDYQNSPYNYCGNNPVVRVDQDGQIWETVWDFGNLLYDIGAAVVNHIKGNHEQAQTHWQDAGVDALAMAIPGLPAGMTKLKYADDLTKTTATVRGIRNEAKVIEDIGEVKNTVRKTTVLPETNEIVTTIPDVISNTKVIEIKDVKKLSNTKQIRAERQVAKDEGKTFEIITGEKTNISKNIPKEEIIRRKDIGPQ